MKPRITKRTAVDLGALLIGCVVIALNLHVVTDFSRGLLRPHYRRLLFAELKPVQLTNCSLARFGNVGDGGYLMCGNLLDGARSAYSYGIEGRDEWGCAVSSAFGIPVHQYDCFVTIRPSCEGASFVFHEECVGDSLTDPGGRMFDTLTSQIARNGDAERRLVLKMDIEGAEWHVLGSTPDAALARIDQLVVEFHETDQRHFVEVVKKLKRTFAVVHVHFNNAACHEGVRPFPSCAYEVLFVNKRIAQVNASGTTSVLPTPLDSPNYPGVRDCQATW